MDIPDILAARERIKPHINVTGVTRYLFEDPDNKSVHNTFVKRENEQTTGSFKVRGSLNKILSLSDEEKKKGVVAASTGNHGLGVAHACSVARIQGEVFLPEKSKKSKIEKLKAAGVQLKFVQGDSLQAEMQAKSYARGAGKVWISPYNDPAVIAGQGTIGLELLEQLPDLQRAFVTVGGGGLISGIAMAIKQVRPEVRIIGCQPKNSPEMSLSVAAGRIINLETQLETLSDGSAGGVEDGSITFDYCRQLVDEWVTVSEAEIAGAMLHALDTHGLVIEGSAGVALAGLLKVRGFTKCDAVILCGGNISKSEILELRTSILRTQ